LKRTYIIWRDAEEGLLIFDLVAT